MSRFPLPDRYRYSEETLLLAATNQMRRAARDMALSHGIPLRDALTRVLRESSKKKKGRLTDALRKQTVARHNDNQKKPEASKQSFLPPLPEHIAWEGWFSGTVDPKNENAMGIGCVLYTPGKEPVRISRTLGPGFDGEAEYLALIALVEAAISMELPAIRVFGSSAVVVNQVLGAWRANHPRLRDLRAQVQRLFQRIPVALVLVDRAQNQQAENLSRQARASVT